MQTFPDFSGGLRDRVDYFAVNELHLEIGERRRFLDRGQGCDERGELAQLDARDREVLDRPESLNPVERRCWTFALAEQIVLSAAGSREVDARRVGGLETQL